MAFEGLTFISVCTQILTAENKDKNNLTSNPSCEAPGRDFAMIWPDSAPLVEPLPPDQEGILYADIDLSMIAFAKQMIEVIGTTRDLVD